MGKHDGSNSLRALGRKMLTDSNMQMTKFLLSPGLGRRGILTRSCSGKLMTEENKGSFGASSGLGSSVKKYGECTSYCSTCSDQQVYKELMMPALVKILE
jgi:hypothetical protein